MRPFSLVTIYNPSVDSEQTPIGGEISGPRTVVVAGLDQRFPIWSLGDVFMVAGFFFLSSLFFIVLGVLVLSGLPAYKTKTMVQIFGDIRIAVLTQFAAYLATFWFVYRMIARHYGVPFLEGIEWNWPRLRSLAYLIGGILLAYAITALQQVVPMPSEVPLDKLLKTTTGMWALAIFGSLLAPFAEEVFFRGLLFPALARRTSVALSVVITGFLFALLHGSQLGWSWGPLLLLLSVGVILTVVRAWSRSVAASVIIHTSYNVTLFVFLYVGTNGFQNLDKVVR